MPVAQREGMGECHSEYREPGQWCLQQLASRGWRPEHNTQE
jgi:hypothetical protein